MHHTTRALLPLLGSLLCTFACGTSSQAKKHTSHAAPTATAPLTLTYLGVAGYRISDGEHVLLVDPYYSRPDLGAEGPLVPDVEAIRARAPQKADLILVGHTHFDHALDVPSVARHTGAEVMGTESMARLARAAGLPATQIISVKGGEDYAFSGFSVRVIPSLHSALDHKHGTGAHQLIDEGARLPMASADYREGGTLAYLVRMAGLRVLVLSTANFIERELEGLEPDVAIVATGLRAEIHDYTCRLMRVLGEPALVLANHFDAWQEPFAPKSRAELAPETRADLARFEDEVHACAPHTRVIVPTHEEPLTVQQAAP